MRKEMYPALFSADGTGGYTVVFPDLVGCVTEGIHYLNLLKWLKMLSVFIYFL